MLFVISKENEQPEWVCTDPDCYQYQRAIQEGAHTVYEMYQVDALPDHYAVSHGVVDFTEFDEDDWDTLESVLGMYGYRGITPDDGRDYDDAYVPERVAAECWFETMIVGRYENIVYRAGTEDECAEYIAQEVSLI